MGGRMETMVYTMVTPWGVAWKPWYIPWYPWHIHSMPLGVSRGMALVPWMAWDILWAIQRRNIARGMYHGTHGISHGTAHD